MNNTDEQKFLFFCDALIELFKILDKKDSEEKHKLAANNFYNKIKDLKNDLDWRVPFSKAYALFISEDYTNLVQALSDIDIDCSKKYCAMSDEVQRKLLYMPFKIIDVDIYRRLSVMYIAINNRDKAEEYSKKASIDLINYNSYRTTEGTIYLYSYRRVTDYTLSEIINKNLSLSSPTQFNDPFDSFGLLWSEYQRLQSANSEIARIERDMFLTNFNHVRIRCFVANDSLTQDEILARNILMWSHYADDHKGICIEYKVDIHKLIENNKSMSFQKVSYKLEQNDLTSKTVLYNQFFTQKAPEWEYESEYRLLDFDMDHDGCFKTICSEAFQVNRIFLGLRCSDDNGTIIQKISPNNVKFFRMKKNINDIYNLQIEPIN
ncbi:MAG: DUF2971 domain-containing protein [Marinifilaceae bacterium]